MLLDEAVGNHAEFFLFPDGIPRRSFLMREVTHLGSGHMSVNFPNPLQDFLYVISVRLFDDKNFSGQIVFAAYRFSTMPLS